MVAFFLPMHTATRLAAEAMGRVRALNPGAHLCCYGLYAPLNGAYLRSLGAGTILGGEFEQGLLTTAHSLETGLAAQAEQPVSLERQQFLVPDRSGLPGPEQYAHLHITGEVRLAGYTEASRGCKHLCRHCPVVPVYNGRFRVVQPEVVLEDIRRQVSAGAQHITFGDPDFLNGPTHAGRIVEGLHAEFPALTYDATTKIEHLRRHRGLLPLLKRTGCILITSAVESLEDEVLCKLDKGHTRADFTDAVADCRDAGIALNATFVPFTPWTTLEGYRGLLSTLIELDLVDAVAPVQLGLRLLITAGSRLLELPDVRALTGPFDEKALVYPWKHPDPEVDALSVEVMRLAASKGPRRATFRAIWELAHGAPPPENFDLMPRATIPWLDEPWFC